MSYGQWPYIRTDDIFTGVYWRPVTRERCWKCGTANPDLAHTMFEYVAALLAEPIRRAFDAHLDQHGCGTGDVTDPRYIGGFGHCDEAMRLFRLLPESEQVIIG